MTSMSTMIKPEIELGEGRSEEEPLRDLLPFIISQDKLEMSVVKDQILSIEPTLPSTMLLGALHNPRLHLIAPLTITFESENDDIIAHCEDLEEFGFGKHLTEAIEDLQAAIAELYFTLKEENNRLGSNLRRIWDRLRQKIEEVS